jgi:hypothetical protein
VVHVFSKKIPAIAGILAMHGQVGAYLKIASTAAQMARQNVAIRSRVLMRC